MRVAVGREELRRGLVDVERAAEQRPVRPVLGALLVATDAGRLRLSATNLELSITRWLPCAVEQEGAIGVPARLLRDFVSDLPGDLVRLDAAPASTSLHIVATSIDTSIDAVIRGLPVEDFPDAADDEATGAGGTRLSVAPDLLRDLVHRTVFAAASADDGQPVLTGVQLHAAANRLTLCATNGRRLSACSHDVVGEPGPETIIIVPARALDELGRLVAEAREPVTLVVAAAGDRLICQTPSAELWARLRDGTFPDWQQSLLRPYRTRIVVERERLLALLRLAAYFARPEGDRMQLSVEPGPHAGDAGALEVSASGAEIGQHAGRMVAAVTGPAVRLILKGEYVQKALATAGTARVALETHGPRSPFIIRPIDGPDHVQLIMPFSPPPFAG